MQIVREWLKKPFRGWFQDKFVRILPSHVGRSLEHTPGWTSPSVSVRERETTREKNSPTSPPPSTRHSQPMMAPAQQTEALRQLESELAEHAFKLKMEGYRSRDVELMCMMKQLKTHVDQKDWTAIAAFIEETLEPRGIQELSIYQRRYRQLATVTPCMPQPIHRTMPPPTSLKHRHTEPMPVPLPTASLSVLTFRNGQVNLCSGDITKINRKVHPSIETIVCPHRSESRRTTTILDTLSGLEPTLNHRDFMDQLQKVESGYSMITGAGKVAERGFKQIVHTVLPEPWDSQPTARLFNAYVSAIKKAHEQGSGSIAIPVLSRYMNLPLKSEAQIAHRAIEYYLSHPDTKPNLPRIYLVFPENPIGEQLRQEHFQLNMKQPVEAPNPATNSPHIVKQQLEHALDGILPDKDGTTIPARMNWITKEVDQLIELIKNGKDPKQSDGIIDYLDEARENLNENPRGLPLEELVLAEKYLEDLDDKLAPFFTTPPD